MEDDFKLTKEEDFADDRICPFLWIGFCVLLQLWIEYDVLTNATICDYLSFQLDLQPLVHKGRNSVRVRGVS